MGEIAKPVSQYRSTRLDKGAIPDAGNISSWTLPRAIESLVMAGAFDSVAPNRRQSLWDAGLYASPKRNGRATLPLSMEDSIPNLANFSEEQRMAGEYRTMGIYPRGHLMEFARSRLPSELPLAQVGCSEDLFGNISLHIGSGTLLI